MQSDDCSSNHKSQNDRKAWIIIDDDQIDKVNPMTINEVRISIDGVSINGNEPKLLSKGGTHCCD